MFAPGQPHKILSWILFLIFGLSALGQLQRIELPFARAVYLHEVAIGVFLVMALIHLKRVTIKLPTSWKAFSFWVLLSFVSLWSQGLPLASPFLYFLRLNTYLAFAAIVFVLIKRGGLNRQFVFNCLVVSLVLVAVFGWAQYLLLPDTRNLVYLGWDDHYLRLISTLFDPGFTGAVLTLGALALQASLFSGKLKEGWGYALRQWSWLITLGALLFTYSRASFLAYAVGGVCLWLLQKKPAHLMVIVLFAFSILILPRGRSEGVRLERTASIAARVESYKDTAPTSLPRLLIGQGWYAQKLETSRQMAGNEVTSHNSAPDNSFLFVFSSLGVIGLVLFLWLLKDVVQLAHWDSLAIAGIFSMSTHALFANTLFYPFVLLYLGTLVAVRSAPDREKW